MAFRPISSQNSYSQNWGQVNDMIRDLNARERVQIFKDDSGTRRVLLGKGKDGFYGLKVSKEDQDVYTAANDQLVFNSDDNVFKIVDSGTVTIPESATYSAAGTDSYGAGATATVNHNLGHIPGVIAFALVGASFQRPVPYTTLQTAASGGILIEVIEYHVDADDVIFFTTGRKYGPGWSASGTIAEATIKYYLLQETAN